MKWLMVIFFLSGSQAQNIVFHGSRAVPKIALTFDADMTSGMQQRLFSGKVKSYNNTDIYHYLQKTHTKATFFLTGLWIQTYPEQSQILANNPLFEVENHSFSHPSFTAWCYGLAPVATQNKKPEITKTKQLLESLPSIHNRYFRFPGGCYNKSDLLLVQKAGLSAVQWDVVGADGGENNPQVIINNVIHNTKNGSIIVLHSHRGKASQTAKALYTIIPALKKKGFEFVTLVELLQAKK